MNNSKYRLLAASLASLTIIAGVTAFFSSEDIVTNAFKSSSLQVKIIEPSWKSGSIVVPDQKVDKDPAVVNTDQTPSYVFMEVTVPAAEITVENTSPDADKGTVNQEKRIPLFRFVDASGNYAADTLGIEQTVNSQWYHMESRVNNNGDGEMSSITYLYAYIGDNGGDTMEVLEPEQRTEPLFNKVIFCNAREDDSLEGSVQNVKIKVYGIQNDFLVSPDETETKAETVWQYLSR